MLMLKEYGVNFVRKSNYIQDEIMTEAVIFDTETTGRKDPVLIEAAWLKLKSISPFRLDSSFC